MAHLVVNALLALVVIRLTSNVSVHRRNRLGHVSPPILDNLASRTLRLNATNCLHVCGLGCSRLIDITAKKVVIADWNSHDTIKNHTGWTVDIVVVGHSVFLSHVRVFIEGSLVSR